MSKGKSLHHEKVIKVVGFHFVFNKKKIKPKEHSIFILLEAQIFSDLSNIFSLFFGHQSMAWFSFEFCAIDKTQGQYSTCIEYLVTFSKQHKSPFL